MTYRVGIKEERIIFDDDFDCLNNTQPQTEKRTWQLMFDTYNARNANSIITTAKVITTIIQDLQVLIQMIIIIIIIIQVVIYIYIYIYIYFIFYFIFSYFTFRATQLKREGDFLFGLGEDLCLY